VGKTSEIKGTPPVAGKFRGNKEPVVVAPGEVSGFYVDPDRPVPAPDPAQLAISRSAYAMTLVAGLNSGWLGLFLPAIVQNQHFSLANAGLLASAMNAGCLTALAASTHLISGLGDKKTTLLAAALTTIGFVGLGTVPGLPAIMVCAFCYGLGVGLNGIASHIIFPRYYPATVASSLSKLNVFYGVGALIGPMLALAAFSAKIQYNYIFVGAGIYTLIVCAYLLSTRGDTKKRSEKRKEKRKEKEETSPKLTGQNLKVLITHPILLSLSLINFLYVGIEATLCSWVYTFLQRADGLNDVMASTAVSLLWTGLALGRVISVKACLKINPKYVTMAAMLLLVSTTFATAIFRSWPVVALPLILIMGLGLGPIFPTIIAQSATRFPTTSSTTTTLVISAGYVGGMLLPWLLGNALVNLGSTNFMLLTGAATALLPVILALSLFRRSQGETKAT